MRQKGLHEMPSRQVTRSITEIVLCTELIEPTLQGEAMNVLRSRHARPAELVHALNFVEQELSRNGNSIQGLLAETEVRNETLF